MNKQKKFKQVGTIKEYLYSLLKFGVVFDMYTYNDSYGDKKVLTAVEAFDVLLNLSGSKQESKLIIPDAYFNKGYLVDQDNLDFLKNENENIKKLLTPIFRVVEIKENITLINNKDEKIDINEGQFMIIKTINEIEVKNREEFYKMYSKCDENGKILTKEVNKNIKNR